MMKLGVTNIDCDSVVMIDVVKRRDIILMRGASPKLQLFPSVT